MESKVIYKRSNTSVVMQMDACIRVCLEYNYRMVKHHANYVIRDIDIWSQNERVANQIVPRYQHSKYTAHQSAQSLPYLIAGWDACKPQPELIN